MKKQIGKGVPLLFFLLSSCASITDIADLADVVQNPSHLAGAAYQVADKTIFAKPKSEGIPEENLEEPKAGAYTKKILGVMSAGTKYNSLYQVTLLKTARVQGTGGLGDIAITRGMLNMLANEAEFACLIGHEIGHTDMEEKSSKSEGLLDEAIDKGLSEGEKAGSDLAGEAVKHRQEMEGTRWSREEEESADEFGAVLAAQKGYDPFALCGLFDRLAGRVNMDIFYRLGKLKDTHKALDKRAAHLRAFLKAKGYEPGAGKIGRTEYVEAMRGVYAIRTGEGAGANKGQAAQETGKNDVKALKDLETELKAHAAPRKPLTLRRFLEIVKSIGVIAKRNGITRDSIKLARRDDQSGRLLAQKPPLARFMAETIYQDKPFALPEADKELIRRVNMVLAALDRVAVGFIPMVNDGAALAEAITGEEFITGRQLSGKERAFSALCALTVIGGEVKGITDGLLEVKDLTSIERAARLGNEVASTARAGREFEAGFSDVKRAGSLIKASIKEEKSLLRSAKDAELAVDEGEDIAKGGKTWKSIAAESENEYLRGLGYEKPPVLPGTTVWETISIKPEKYYRVWARDEDNLKGAFILDFNPSGYTPAQLKKMLALPYMPTNWAMVDLKAGTRLRVSIVNSIEEFGEGGVRQWYLVDTENAGAVFKDMGGLSK